MRAAVHTRYGPPEVVRVTEVDAPVAREDEVLVKVRATTVNRTDCGYRAGTPAFIRLFSGLRGPKATVLGCEFAGEVMALGTGVDSIQVGDRLFGYLEGSFGGHAEYVTVRADGSIAAIPQRMTYEQAAPITEGAHYALADLIKARVGAGKDVLVYGATGAIGSAAVQLAVELGATVTAVCATDHVELVEGLGAHRVIDYLKVDFTQDAERFDVVFDAVGKSSFGSCKHLLRPRGIYLSTDLGPFPWNPLLALVTPPLGGRRVQFPVPRDNAVIVNHLASLVEAGTFSPVIDRTYPLEDIVEAYRYVESGQKIGNVVITL
jgi:NADPH:quinone reductase-like Zn-dependent oxidoreductase